MTTIKKLSSIVIELPKSKLPAGIAEIQGGYLFFVSGPETKHCDEFIYDGEAVVLSTGGNAAIHFGKGRFAYSTDCWALEPKKDEVYPLYLYQWLLQKQYQIDTLGFEGSGLRHLKKDYVRSFEISLPKLPIQIDVAKILSTLDQAIEQTEAIIAKQQRIKTGLMQDLLTKGIDENGNIRSEATHEFKDSLLGRIPVEWDVAQLHEFAAAIDPQPDHRTPPQIDNGVPYIGISDFNEDEAIDFAGARKISFTAYRKQRKAFIVELGDFIFGKIGTIGTPKRLPTDFDYALSANVILLKPKDKSTFVFWWMVSTIVENLVAQEIHSTSQPAFGIQKMRSLSIPRLTNIEQHQIGKVFDKLAETMSAESTRLVKLRKLKAGLMHDLLTGKVRVPHTQNYEVLEA